MKRNKKAFTLIELLVVVLIIGILSAVALPQYQKAVEKSRFSEALISLNQLEKAIDLYVLENGCPTDVLDFKDHPELLYMELSKLPHGYSYAKCDDSHCDIMIDTSHYYLWPRKGCQGPWKNRCYYYDLTGKSQCELFVGGLPGWEIVDDM